MKLLVLLLALWAGVAHANVCPRLTKVPFCSECRRNVCLYCATGYGEVWTGGGTTLKVTACTKATACPAGAAYANCAQCVPAAGFPAQPTCIACKTVVNRVSNMGFQRQDKSLVWANGPNFGRCMPAKATAVSGNTNCAEFNPDGTCKLCKAWQVAGTQKGIVLPTNAVFTNGVFPMSSCPSRSTLAIMSTAALGRDMTRTAFIPADCVEVGPDFKCMRCRPTWALTVVSAVRYTCKAPTAVQTRAGQSANGCTTKLAFQEYCQRCLPTNANRCAPTGCVPGRSQGIAGFCSLPCKQLFGVSCSTCTATACTGSDAAFPNGRR